MKPALNIGVAWDYLEQGDPEEVAAFGMLTISNQNIILTEGVNGFSRLPQQGCYVSAYHLAEWMAWNLPQLTGEARPEKPSYDWLYAHAMRNIDQGYIWPNITIWSEHGSTTIHATPSSHSGFATFRYTANCLVVVPTEHFRTAAWKLFSQVQNRLREKNVPETNLDLILEDLRTKRSA